MDVTTKVVKAVWRASDHRVNAVSRAQLDVYQVCVNHVHRNASQLCLKITFPRETHAVVPLRTPLSSPSFPNLRTLYQAISIPGLDLSTASQGALGLLWLWTLWPYSTPPIEHDNCCQAAPLLDYREIHGWTCLFVDPSLTSWAISSLTYCYLLPSSFLSCHYASTTRLTLDVVVADRHESLGALWHRSYRFGPANRYPPAPGGEYSSASAPGNIL